VLRARQGDDGAVSGEGGGHLRGDGEAGSGGDQREDGAEVVGLEDGGHLDIAGGAGVLAGGEHVVAEAVTFFEKEETFAEEVEVGVFDFGREAGGEAMVAGSDEDEGVAHEERTDDVAGLKAFNEALGEVFGELEFDVGVLVEEVGEARGDEIREDGGDDADAEGASDVGGEVADGGGGLAGLVEDLLRVGEEAVAGVGEADGAALAGEELSAEGLLEAADLLREGGLGDAFLLGGFGEAAGFDDGAEVAELVEFHKAVVSG
jgi:hypothetical protein